MPHRITACDALSCAFTSCDQTMHNREMADRAIAWLDECGYQIVPKDQVTLAPPELPTEIDRRLAILLQGMRRYLRSGLLRPQASFDTGPAPSSGTRTPRPRSSISSPRRAIAAITTAD